ncbi:hypothetical protein BDW22DRAFT_1444251 [Trametopsis cervina]|nr:hypothetical protein BDW22DRAFT_1444251 [Trametopsis cervina]
MLRFFVVLLAGFSLLFSCSLAQNFAIPSTWRKPTSGTTRNDRITLVNGLLDTILPTFNSSSGLLDGLTFTQTASLLCAMATGDMINSSTTNHDAVTKSLNTVFTQTTDLLTSSSFSRRRIQVVNSDPALWGLAAIDSYRAYKDKNSLDFAAAMWEQLTKYMITPANAAAGSHPLKSVSIPSTCNGATTAGGVFYLTSSANTDVNGETVAAYMALSAHLYEATSNPQYLNATEMSANFIATQLYNGVVILDTITVTNCLTTTDVVTYNSGFTIEGLSILSAKNSTYTTFLNDLIATAIPNTAWTNSSDGIIIEGPKSATDANTNDFGQALKSILIRGLYEAFIRSSNGSVIADLISSFITVQFNALQDLASKPGSNMYSSRWEGPPPPDMQPWGQLAALDVLNAAVGIALPSGPNSTPSTGTGNGTVSPSSISPSSGGSPPSQTGGTSAPDNDPNTNSHAHTAAIAGGVVGAVILLALIALFFFLRFRKHRRQDYIRSALEETAVPYAAPPHTTDTHGSMVQTSDPFAAGLIMNSTSPRRTRHDTNGKRSLAELYYAPEAGSSHDSSHMLSPKESDNPPTVASSTNEAPPPPEASSRSNAEAERNTNDLAAVPALIERLNMIMSRLPPGGSEDEAPPEYEG